VTRREQINQLGSMAIVGIIALAFGSLLKAEASPTIPIPSPSPLPSIAQLPIAAVTAEPSPIASPFANPSPVISLASKLPSPVPSPITRRSTVWGITIKTLPLREGNEAFLPKQFQLAKELGVDTVRVDYSTTYPALNRLAVDEAKKSGLKLIFIIPFGSIDIFTDPHVTERTTALVKSIVEEYKTDVHVWQLGNEVASVAIRQNENLYGIDQVDYPEDRYKAVATWLKAATATIRQTDPSAKVLVTDAYVHTGFFDRYLAEGGDFDILGWDWYSWISDDMNSVPLEGRPGRFRLLSKLATYKKEIWLTEVSRNLGSYGENQLDRQEEQAAFIESVAKQMFDSKTISGFFVYNLIQDQTQPENLRAFGIVNVDPEHGKIIGVKAAFDRYRNLIKANR
jgi:hypothetical protein